MAGVGVDHGGGCEGVEVEDEDGDDEEEEGEWK